MNVGMCVCVHVCILFTHIYIKLVFSHPFGRYLWMEPRYCKNYFSILSKAHTVLHKNLTILQSQGQYVKISFFFFWYRSFSKMREYLMALLICIFLKTNNEHLFMFLFANSMSSLEKCELCSAAQSLCCFLFCWVVQVHCKSWISSPWQLYELQIFSSIQDVSFVLMAVFFFHFYVVTLLYSLHFFFFCLCRWIHKDMPKVKIMEYFHLLVSGLNILNTIWNIIYIYTYIPWNIIYIKLLHIIYKYI